MNPLFKALLERELKSIFGDLLTHFVCEEHPEDAITIGVSNLDKTRPEGKQLAQIYITISNDEIKEAKFPLDLFGTKVKNAYTTMKHFIEEEAA
jgi:hypothetical protein